MLSSSNLLSCFNFFVSNSWDIFAFLTVDVFVSCAITSPSLSRPFRVILTLLPSFNVVSASMYKISSSFLVIVVE